MYYVNRQSHKVYRIAETTTLEDGTPIKVIERVGDLYSTRIGDIQFAVKYRPATAAENQAIQAVAAELRQTGRTRTVYEITGEAAPVAAPPEGLTQEGQEAERRLSDPARKTDTTIGIFVEPTERNTFDNLILHKETLDSVKTGLNMIKKNADIDKVFGISKIESVKGRCVLNFFGAPGTGKTETAKAIARELGKKLLQVDYSQMISKYVGDTAKHIKEAFIEAKKADAILFWDEADAMLSKRVSMGEGGEANSINQNRNVLMQELDRFDGIVLMTTNFFGNYDEAILRRIAQHVEFKLPDSDMRFKLLNLHLPIRDAVLADLELIATRTDGFSGGDILNLCKNSMYAAANDSDDTKTWKITDDIMLKEAEKIRNSKEVHKKGGAGTGKYRGNSWL